jgi:hypothetical protein
MILVRRPNFLKNREHLRPSDDVPATPASRFDLPPTPGLLPDSPNTPGAEIETPSTPALVSPSPRTPGCCPSWLRPRTPHPNQKNRRRLHIHGITDHPDVRSR